LSRLSIVLLAALLVGVVILQVVPRETKTRKWERNVSLATVLPHQMSDWIDTDLPLGETEGVREAVEKTLNYSEAVFRSYRRGDEEVSVYVAYWNASRSHPRLISDHVPDICWVSAGWKMTDTNYRWLAPSGRSKLKPGQYRVFSKQQNIQHVVYWHLVGGELSGFSEGPGSRSDSFFEDLRSNPVQKRGEQYFIRISGNLDLDKIWDDGLIQRVVESLGPAGLAIPSVVQGSIPP
jgi:hypothetical protein